MAPRRSAWLLALAALGVALGGACEGESEPDADEAEDATGDARAAIVDGVVEKGRPAVVAIVASDFPEDLICSGVLVTPDIVVTAAHCLHPHITGVEPDHLLIVFGPSLAEGTMINVELGAYHPEWRVDDPEQRNDIGAVRLLIDAPVDPIAIGSSPEMGEDVVLVGYGSESMPGDGQGEDDIDGEKRSGHAVVGEVGDSWFRMDRSPSTTCAGDSGGATLAEIGGAEVLLGVHSRGDCETAVWNERLDVHSGGFLKSFMGAWGGCNQDGACALGCPGPDPDCPCAADDKCNDSCGSSDPDCGAESSCAEGEPLDDAGNCVCEGEDCRDPAPGPSAGWGGAGCSVGSPSGGDGLLAAIAALALAGVRRARRRPTR